MSTRMMKRALIALDRADYVVASIRTQKPKVTAELNRVFDGALPEGIPVPDWDALQDAHISKLSASIEAVRRADQGHRQNQAAMRNLREERQEVFNDLIRQYRTLRNSIEGTYPEAGLIVLGVEEPPIRRHVAVREQMPEILQRLQDPELATNMPAPLPGHQPLDFGHFADSMATGIQELETYMESIRQMRKMLDESLLARREALKENRQTYLHLARIQEGYYRLAGLEELADRIRTEVYRLSPRRKAKEGDAQAEPSQQDPTDNTSPAEPPSTSEQNAPPDSPAETDG